MISIFDTNSYCITINGSKISIEDIVSLIDAKRNGFRTGIELISGKNDLYSVLFVEELVSYCDFIRVVKKGKRTKSFSWKMMNTVKDICRSSGAEFQLLAK